MWKIIGWWFWRLRERVRSKAIVVEINGQGAINQDDIVTKKVKIVRIRADKKDDKKEKP